jgi:hypothetical protein
MVTLIIWDIYLATDGKDSVDIGQSQRITVKSGDKFGWYVNIFVD